jgi:hypothetical protein
VWWRSGGVNARKKVTRAPFWHGSSIPQEIGAGLQSLDRAFSDKGRRKLVQPRLDRAPRTAARNGLYFRSLHVGQAVCVPQPRNN